MRKAIKGIILIFIILSSLYVSAIFILPLLRIDYAFPLFSNRNPDPYRMWNFYLFIDVIPFIGIVFSYFLFIIYAVTSIYITHTTFSQKFLRMYAPYERLHKISIVLTIPFLFLLGFELFASTVFHSALQFGYMLVVFTIVLWLIWSRFSRTIFGKIWGVVAILFALFGILVLIGESIPQIHPRVYEAFSLNDRKGIYMINYDGDYWLTYYINKPICWQKNNPGGQLEKVCKDNLAKKGNTAIIEAPTDLKPYLDKPVKVQGSFVPVLPPIYPDNPYREFCVSKPKRSCRKSKGPGTWYFSPLKLKSVQFVNK